MKKKPKDRNESGQSLMELALSMTVLLILLAGVVDLGRAFFTYIALRDAAQEGASYAAVYAGANAMDQITAGDLNDYCTAITDRTLVTSGIAGSGDSNALIDLQRLANDGEVTVETQITANGNTYACTSVPPADVCLGSAISVRVSYNSFPMTMPFMGAIVGSQTIRLSAVVADAILTPACQ